MFSHLHHSKTDRTPSPRLLGGLLGPKGGREGKKVHSPWTASKPRKKNKGQDRDDELPLYSSDEENQGPQPAGGQS